jgi:hypothetical protein
MRKSKVLFDLLLRSCAHIESFNAQCVFNDLQEFAPALRNEVLRLHSGFATETSSGSLT